MERSGFWWPSRQFRVELSGASPSQGFVQKSLDRGLFRGREGAMGAVLSAGFKTGASKMIGEAHLGPGGIELEFLDFFALLANLTAQSEC